MRNGIVLRITCFSLSLWAGSVLAEDASTQTQKVAPTAFNKEEPTTIHGWGQGDGKSYWVPVADITGFLFGLNVFDRLVMKGSDYDANPSSWERNITGGWVYDNDPFDINQFLHPYQGAMHHGFARSAGHDFASSWAYANLGSLMWELFGETTPPAINDQIMTGTGGAFLGEALFRLASLNLESGGGGIGFWRELTSAVISPASGFNRWYYGDRFDGVFQSREPAVYTRGQLGFNVTSKLNSNVRLDRTAENEGRPQSYDKGEAVADFTVAYGMPGKPGYRYDRPFDYFHLQFTAATGNILENLMVRGLLRGSPYSMGDDYRGVWGLYGTYDYIAPQVFRISTTGLGLGTAGQWWLSQRNALQVEAVAALGYGSGGVIEGPGERDYHSGITPQALLSARLLLDDRLSLDLTGRSYHITDKASENEGAERILRGEAGFTYRVTGLHGVSVRYVASRRDARHPGDPATHQSVGAISVAYAYLGHKWFGAVDWRPIAQVRTPEEGAPSPVIVVPLPRVGE